MLMLMTKMGCGGGAKKVEGTGVTSQAVSRALPKADSFRIDLDATRVSTSISTSSLHGLDDKGTAEPSDAVDHYAQANDAVGDGKLDELVNVRSRWIGAAGGQAVV